MEEANQQSTTFLRGDSNVPKTTCSVCLSLRKIVTALVILNILFVGLFGVTFYLIFDLKKQSNLDVESHKTRIEKPSAYSSGRDGSGRSSPSSTDTWPSKGVNSRLKTPVTPSFKTPNSSFESRRKATLSSRTDDTTKQKDIDGSKVVRTTIVSRYFGKRNQDEDCSCRGPQGDQGPIGPPGPPGPKGSAAKKKGRKGDKGPRGYDGLKGEKGSNGSPGPIGLTGFRGSRGLPGKVGPDGSPGPQGKKGEPGGKGVKGQKGDKGDGTVTVRDKPRPFCHITGTVSRRKSNREPRGIIRKEWRDFGLFAKKGNGFTFSNGELHVPETGMYYVYSQVYFNHNDDDKDPNIAHFMYRKSGSEGETILTSLITRSVQLGVNPVLYNSYTGGLFYLRKGDKLMVGVSEELLNMARFVETLSYFGAFLVERY